MKFFLLLFAGVIISCKNEMISVDRLEKETSGPVSLLKDIDFETGISLKGNTSGSPIVGESLYPFGKKGEVPAWELAEWGSKYVLHQNEMIEEDGEVKYENPGKFLSFTREGTTTKIHMDVKASAEYDHARKDGEYWPHLLLAQTFSVKPILTSIDKLILNFEGRFVSCVSHMSPDSFNSGLHSAQIQLYLTLQNLNPQSASYGELVWFGIPFYDFRYRQLEVYAAKDIGKDDASGIFIYSIATTDYMQGSFHDGNWVKIEKDLKPFMIKAVNLAMEKGYLKGASLNDIRISALNIGWEVPGTFDAAFEFRGLGLKYQSVKK